MTYSHFGPEEDFNSENYKKNNTYEEWDFGAKELALDINLIESPPSPLTSRLKRQKPR